LKNAWIINSCDNAWIINSFYFEYRRPIRSDYETTLSIRYVYFCSEHRTNPIGFPHLYSLVDTPVNRVPPPLLWAAVVWAPLKRENIEIRLSISFVVKTVYLVFLGVTKTETLRTLLTPTILISIFKTQNQGYILQHKSFMCLHSKTWIKVCSLLKPYRSLFPFLWLCIYSRSNQIHPTSVQFGMTSMQMITSSFLQTVFHITP
jgi:hypothetical protein